MENRLYGDKRSRSIHNPGERRWCLRTEQGGNETVVGRGQNLEREVAGFTGTLDVK